MSTTPKPPAKTPPSSADAAPTNDPTNTPPTSNTNRNPSDPKPEAPSSASPAKTSPILEPLLNSKDESEKRPRVITPSFARATPSPIRSSDAPLRKPSPFILTPDREPSPPNGGTSPGPTFKSKAAQPSSPAPPSLSPQPRKPPWNSSPHGADTAPASAKPPAPRKADKPQTASSPRQPTFPWFPSAASHRTLFPALNSLWRLRFAKRRGRERIPLLSSFRNFHPAPPESECPKRESMRGMKMSGIPPR